MSFYWQFASRFSRYATFITTACIFSLTLPASAQTDVSEAQKEAVHRLFTEIVSENDMTVVGEILADDYVNHGLGDDMDVEAYLAYLEGLRTAVPDLEATVEVLIAEEDWAASRVVFTGTFENDWTAGETTVPSNDAALAWTLIILHRFDDENRIVEDFTAADPLDLLCQMDAAPLPDALAGTLCGREYVPVTMEAPVSEGMEEAQKDAFTHVIEDALNNGDLTAIDTYMAEDYLTDEPFGRFTREQFRDVVIGFRAAVPDLEVAIDVLISEGDWLAARLIYTGTVTGDVPDLSAYGIEPPSGNSIRFIINVLVRFNEDAVGIADYKEYNRLVWLQQLGILPLPEANG